MPPPATPSSTFLAAARRQQLLVQRELARLRQAGARSTPTGRFVRRARDAASSGSGRARATG